MFAIATRDELWLRGRCIERRLSHGAAVDDGDRIIASDAFDAELVHAAGEELARLHAALPLAGRVRLVASARRAGGRVVREGTMTIDGMIVTDGEVVAVPVVEPRAVHDTLLWRDGSAAVLLHEAVGHAAEHDACPVAWPTWLTVHDEPPFAFDDCGNPTETVDLLREGPKTMRRASFRDVPLPRMTRLVARAVDAPWHDEEAVEIHLVKGGSYDPLTDVVTIEVAVSTAGAFTIRKSRAEIAASLVGAIGDPIRYPGVICSREGQELAVGSFAPVMMTR